ncbi:MAG: chemotaxis protein CheW [Pirellulaceae bacterium]|jgi:purine-binding chemotaxis protein CheW|nr:chemotaxis protein CheW [Pirellulaceae bacterium]
MNTASSETASATGTTETELVTFRVGDMLMGVDIRQVEEINRHVQVTAVPHAREYVRGVINLRGEVVTVVDLRTVLGLPPVEITKQTRTVVVRSKDEQIGLRVDRIGDVVKARTDEIDAPPANFGGLDGRLCKGVYKLETDLLVLLDVEAALVVEPQAA